MTDIPEFYQIEKLYVAKGQLYILTRALEVERFDRHLFSYSVCVTNKLQIHEPGGQFQYNMLDLYGGTYIVPKWEMW